MKICPACDGWSTCTGWCDKCGQRGVVGAVKEKRMTVMATVDPRLEWFVGQMRAKLSLDRNQEKDDWRGADLEDIFAFLMKEVTELHKAILTDSGHKIAEEAADVANFAMMLADMTGLNKVR